MRPFWRLAVLPAFLFACAQAAPPVKDVQMLERPACESTTRLAIRMAFARSGVEPTAELEGYEAVALRTWLVARAEGLTMPAANQALVFVNGFKALVAFFEDDCYVGRIIGPWFELAIYLGIKTGEEI